MKPDKESPSSKLDLDEQMAKSIEEGLDELGLGKDDSAMVESAIVACDEPTASASSMEIVPRTTEEKEATDLRIAGQPTVLGSDVMPYQATAEGRAMAMLAEMKQKTDEMHNRQVMAPNMWKTTLPSISLRPEYLQQPDVPMRGETKPKNGKRVLRSNWPEKLKQFSKGSELKDCEGCDR